MEVRCWARTNISRQNDPYSGLLPAASSRVLLDFSAALRAEFGAFYFNPAFGADHRAALNLRPALRAEFGTMCIGAATGAFICYRLCHDRPTLRAKLCASRCHHSAIGAFCCAVLGLADRAFGSFEYTSHPEGVGKALDC